MKTPSFVWTAASRSVKRINEEKKNGLFFLMELHYDRRERILLGFFSENAHSKEWRQRLFWLDG